MVIVKLHCGHVKRINDEPRVDEKCEECGRIILVEDYWPEKWHMVCDCGVTTSHGYSRVYAERNADLHRRRDHRPVIRWYADAPASVTRSIKNSQENFTKSLTNLDPNQAPPF